MICNLITLGSNSNKLHFVPYTNLHSKRIDLQSDLSSDYRSRICYTFFEEPEVAFSPIMFELLQSCLQGCYVRDNILRRLGCVRMMKVIFAKDIFQKLLEYPLISEYDQDKTSADVERLVLNEMASVLRGLINACVRSNFRNFAAGEIFDLMS